MWLCHKLLPRFLSLQKKKGNAIGSNEDKDLGSAYKVVLKLLEIGQYLNKGYNVFVENFFISIPLASLSISFLNKPI